MIMMLVAMSCILFFNHYDLLTGMVPKTWDFALYTEIMRITQICFFNTTAEGVQHIK